MAELLRDVNNGGASSSENVKTLRIVPKSKKKDLESLHLSYCFLSKKRSLLSLAFTVVEKEVGIPV